METPSFPMNNISSLVEYNCIVLNSKKLKAFSIISTHHNKNHIPMDVALNKPVFFRLHFLPFQNVISSQPWIYVFIFIFITFMDWKTVIDDFRLNICGNTSKPNCPLYIIQYRKYSEISDRFCQAFMWKWNESNKSVNES